MYYESVDLSQEIIVNKIVSIHYFEYMSNFSFPGETHDFWEFLYVDKGEVQVIADDKNFTFKKGQIIFHKPNEFHALKANGRIAPNLVVIAFHCKSSSMHFFENKIFQVNELERNLLGRIIIEAKKTYRSRLDDPYLKKLKKNTNPPFGGEQLIKISLEHFLIELVRQYTLYDSVLPKKQLKSTKKIYDDDTCDRILKYMEISLDSKLTIGQICSDNLIGRSYLQNLFQERYQCGVIEYFSKMKIETAKQHIRDNYMNFTQIAEQLGYSSIHYFSRQFKKTAGMTPSEYSSSIKSLAENPFNDSFSSDKNI